MSEQQPASSEPIYVKIKDGSDRVYKSISMYELLKLEHAINESEPGHIKEMHDAGNETIDKVRSRPFPDCSHCTKIEERPPENKYAEQIRAQEREKVLKGILMAMNDPQLSICDTGYLEHAYWVDYIKSLRGNPK